MNPINLITYNIINLFLFFRDISLGKLPIKIPSTVDITNENSILKVKGTFGTLERTIPETIGIEQTEGNLIINLKKNN